MVLDFKGGVLSFTDLASYLLERVAQKRNASKSEKASEVSEGAENAPLSKVITFPYSRHSSYRELCELVRIFKPKDVYPCTVDEDHWVEGKEPHLTLNPIVYLTFYFTNKCHTGRSMETLFGKECSSKTFRHDNEMRKMQLVKAVRSLSADPDTQKTMTTRSSQAVSLSSPSRDVVSALRDIHGVRRNSRGSLEPFDSEGKGLSEQRLAAMPIIMEALSQMSRSSRSSRSKSQPLAQEEANPFDSPIQIVDTKGKDKAARGRKNSEGYTIPSDADDLRNSPSQSAVSPSPRDILAVTPSSETQSLRRKLIMDDFGEGSSKRPRYEADGPHSFPVPEERSWDLHCKEASGPSTSGGAKEINLGCSLHNSQAPNLISSRPSIFMENKRVDIRGSTIVTTESLDVDARTSLAITVAEEETTQWSISSDSEVSDHTPDAGEFSTFWDEKDEIFRCSNCSHEVVRTPDTTGYCPSCDRGSTPYYENLESEEPIPGLARDEYTEEEVEGADKARLFGDCMDYQTSAYDTQDEALMREEYEQNSFIDDKAPPETLEEEADSSSEGEIDYKEE